MLRFIYFVTVVAAILSFADAIRHGENAQPFQYPYTAGLSLFEEFYSDKYTPELLCGGAVISNNLVITTATCLNFHPVNEEGIIRNVTITLYLGGQTFFSQNRKSEYKFQVNESNVILHPKYNENKKMEFDIGLIRLPINIKESDKLKIVSLPPENLDLPVGKGIIITGWGSIGHNDDHLPVMQVLNTQVVPKEYCSDLDKSVTEDNICVYTPHKSICEGDSGSPNYIKLYREKGKKILVGLSQRLLATDTEANCERNLPHLSISIIPHLSWINSEIDKNRISE